MKTPLPPSDEEVYGWQRADCPLGGCTFHATAQMTRTLRLALKEHLRYVHYPVSQPNDLQELALPALTETKGEVARG